MPTEAKVSNPATNSVKRLNRDAAAKAYQWTQEFGPRNVVLAGVFKTHNLRSPSLPSCREAPAPLLLLTPRAGTEITT
jgi:hypothetical protein